MKKILIIYYLVFLSNHLLFARPEYALERSSSCIMCHVLPSGAGPRNIAGKIFGSKTFPPAQSSQQDLVYGDFRAEYFSPAKKPETKSNGLGLMISAVSLNYPVYSRDNVSLNFVATHEMGTLARSAGSREQVLLWKYSGNSPYRPDQIVFGKFYQPFGLLTDEHRTYTKMQYPSSLRDYEMGVLAAWDFDTGIHVDLGASNGYQSEGSFTNADSTSASLINIRWVSDPILIGLSHSAHSSKTKIIKSPFASAAYFGLRIWRLFLTSEMIQSKGWNDNSRATSFFFGPSSTAYQAAIKESVALGSYTQLRLNINDILAIIYKLDQFMPDEKNHGDIFVRHGLGLRWYFDSNLSIDFRAEKAYIGRADLRTDVTKASEDLYFAHLRFWL